MGWLTELLRSIAPAFVRALGLLADPGAVLYWEGRTNRVLAAWLDRLTLEPRPPASFGITPVPDFYHLPLDPGTLDVLASRIDRPGAVGRRIRLHLRQSDRIILQWRRAFSREPVLLSRSLDPARLDAFEAAVQSTITP